MIKPEVMVMRKNSKGNQILIWVTLDSAAVNKFPSITVYKMCSCVTRKFLVVLTCRIFC